MGNAASDPEFLQLRLGGPIPHDFQTAPEGSSWQVDPSSPPQGRIPSESFLMRVELADVDGHVALRRSLNDILVLRPINRSSKITIRDGVALHFDYVTRVSISPGFHLDQLATILDAAQAELRTLKLTPQSGTVVISTNRDIKDLTQGTENRLVHSDSHQPWATVIDEGFPLLGVTTACLTSPDKNDAVNSWFMHQISCLGSQDLLRNVTRSVGKLAESLAKAGSVERLPDDLITFDTTLEASHEVDGLWRELSLRRQQQTALMEFRRTCISERWLKNGRTPLHEAIYQQHAEYYAEPLEIALGVLQRGVAEVDRRSDRLLELTSLAYNVRLQATFKRLQWSIVVALASLIVALVAIVLTV